MQGTPDSTNHRSIRPLPSRQQVPTNPFDPYQQYMVNLRQVNTNTGTRPRTAPGTPNTPPPPRRNSHWGGEPFPNRQPSHISPQLPSDFHTDHDIPYMVQRHYIADVDTSREIQSIKTQLNTIKTSLERAQLVLSLISDTLETFDLHTQ